MINLQKLYSTSHVFIEILPFIEYSENITNIPNIYLVRVPVVENEYIYKLGYATDIDRRLSQYTANNPTAEICGLTYAEEGVDKEQEIHKEYSAICRYEWYTEEVIKEIVKKFKWVTHKTYIKNCTSVLVKSTTAKDTIYSVKPAIIEEVITTETEPQHLPSFLPIISQEIINKKIASRGEKVIKPSYTNLVKLLINNLENSNVNLKEFKKLEPTLYNEIVESYLVLESVTSNRITNLKSIVSIYRNTLLKNSILDFEIIKEFDLDI